MLLHMSTGQYSSPEDIKELQVKLEDGDVKYSSLLENESLVYLTLLDAKHELAHMKDQHNKKLKELQCL